MFNIYFIFFQNDFEDQFTSSDSEPEENVTDGHTSLMKTFNGRAPSQGEESDEESDDESDDEECGDEDSDDESDDETGDEQSCQSDNEDDIAAESDADSLYNGADLQSMPDKKLGLKEKRKHQNMQEVVSNMFQ